MLGKIVFEGEDVPFHDPNKEYVLAYITNAGYITQCSLDTDWVAAYNDIRNRLQK